MDNKIAETVQIMNDVALRAEGLQEIMETAQSKTEKEVMAWFNSLSTTEQQAASDELTRQMNQIVEAWEKIRPILAARTREIRELITLLVTAFNEAARQHERYTAWVRAGAESHGQGYLSLQVGGCHFLVL